MRGDADLVDRERPVGRADERHRVGDAVAAEHRDLAVVQPGQAVGMQPGHAVEPAASRLAGRRGPSATSRMSPGRDPDALRGLGRLEVGDA